MTILQQDAQTHKGKSRPRRQHVPAYVEGLWEAFKRVPVCQFRQNFARDVAEGVRRMAEHWGNPQTGPREPEGRLRAEVERLSLLMMVLLPHERRDIARRINACLGKTSCFSLRDEMVSEAFALLRQLSWLTLRDTLGELRKIVDGTPPPAAV